MARTDPRDLAPVAEGLDRLESADAVHRLHDRDASLFSPDAAIQALVAERLGWLDVVAAAAGFLERLTAAARATHDSGFRRVLLVGMGGSSLAAEVFGRVFGDTGDAPVLDVLDSTHPDAVAAALDDTDLQATLVVVASKSGTTEETRAFGAHAARLVPDASHLIAITDQGSALEAQGLADGWRDVVINPADIGGRFSALSYFGMLPAALVGVPVEAVWQSAADLASRAAPGAALRENPAAVLGAFMAGLAGAGRDKLTLLIAPELAAVGDWVEQLVAESTGKTGTGVVPIVGEPVGAPRVYGEDRAFVEVRLGGRPVEGATAIADAGLPLLVLDVPEPTDVGAVFLQWELATAYAGALLGVNPFDEPNVTESKDNTRAALNRRSEIGEMAPAPDGDVATLLASVRPGDYLSLQAYLPITADAQATLALARTIARDRLGVATTVGFGPRLLHSTGQLHKGGPDSLLALQLVDTPRGGPDIPGRDYDFAALIQAQAAGDLASLRAHDRRVARLTLEPAHLHQVVTAMEDATA